MSVEQKLEQLTELYAQRDLLMLDRKRAEDDVIPAEIKKHLEDIGAEYAPQESAIAEKVAALEAEVKAEVIAGGVTVRGGALQAVFSKGRTTWDTKSLDGYLKAHPELEEYRKVGEPSVSIRKL